MLSLKKLHISVDHKPIVKDLSLTIKPKEIHAVMGPNGSGKSTLAHTLAGHPHYSLDQGKVILNKKDLTQESPDVRAQSGLFLAFQYPVEIDGVSVQNFLKTAYDSIHQEKIQKVLSFRKTLQIYAGKLGLDPEFLSRSLNVGFSGGEKKRVEVLQMLALKPKIAVLDETDSGLDIDSIKLAAKGINQTIQDNQTGVLLITHYQRILEFVKPTHVHIMVDGRIVQSGGLGLVIAVENSGYQQFVSK